MTQTAFHHARPVYEEHDGWWEDISKCRHADELPDNARRYIERIEELAGARVSRRRRRPRPGRERHPPPPPP